MLYLLYLFIFFFFNDTATTEIYTLSLHDALPISPKQETNIRCQISQCSIRRHNAIREELQPVGGAGSRDGARADVIRDRKSTRLNSSHSQISYAVFCLKKKKRKK